MFIRRLAYSSLAGGMMTNLRSRLLLISLLAVAALAIPSRAQAQATAVYVMNVDGSQVRKLARADGYEQHTFPRWSHDGKRVAFDAQLPGKTERTLFVVNADGSGLGDVGVGSMPFWSPDDKQLAFYFFAPGGRPQIAVQNLDGTARTELGPGKSPCFSPDGGQIAATDTKNVTLTDLVTGDAIDLFEQSYQEVFRGFRFSPDGKRLAVTVLSGEGPLRRLLIVDAGGAAKGVRIRLKSDLGGFVSFSPDGKRLIYGDGFTLHILEVDSNNPPKTIPGQLGHTYHPDWSPDGKTIVFVSDREAT
jgi:Tol biopolymer transport system component